MQKIIFFLMTLFTLTFTTSAQQGLNYKAIIYDGGAVLTNQSITVQFTILENGTNAVYDETHTTTTDSNGIIVLNIGEGTSGNGDFDLLNWSNNLFLQVEIDKGNGYQDFGTTAFKYVPYAKWADQAANVPTQVSELANDSGYLTTEIDGSTTNELQTISKTGNTVTLSNGGGSFTDADTDTHLTETEVDNFVSNNGYLTSETDGSTTNELQTISKTGNTVTLSNGGGSFTDADTDTHLTETEVDNFVANNGYLTIEVDGSTTNELQTLSISGDQLSISDGNTITLPASGNSDVDFLEVGTGTAPNNILDNIYHTGNISLGHTATPTAKLDIKNTGSATAANANTGLYIKNDNASATDKIGIKTILESGSTAKVYGAKHALIDTGDGNIYGNYADIGGFNGNGDHYGNYNSIHGDGNGNWYGNYQSISSGTVTGTHTGSKVSIYTYGLGEQIGYDVSINTLHASNNSQITGLKTHITGEATGDKFGVQNLLEGAADGNLFGVENTISNTSDYPHYGTINRMLGSGSGNHFATSNIITGDGTGIQYGVRNYNSNTGNNTHYGVYSKLNGSGSGQHIATHNLLQGAGTGVQIGVNTEVSNTSNGTHYGIRNTLNGSGTGEHYGSHALLSGTGTGAQTGAFYEISNTGGGTHTGVKTLLTGSGTYTQTGFQTEISNTGDSYQSGVVSIVDNTGNGVHSGVSTRLSGTGTGTQYGNKVKVNNSGSGIHYGNYIELSGGTNSKFGQKTIINSTDTNNHTDYGNYIQMSGSGTGDKYGEKIVMTNTNHQKHYGNYVDITNSGLGYHYGYYAKLGGNANGNKYGVYAEMNSNASGPLYAVYGKSTRTTGTSYAGYFEGNVKVTKKIQAPVSGTADMKAYMYGQVNADGTIVTSASSDGFTVNKTGTGKYDIVFDTPVSSATSYTVICNIIDDYTGFVTPRQRYTNKVYIEVSNSNATYKNRNFTFVIYKR